MPEGLWSKCDSCGAVLYAADLEKNAGVCPKCDHHNRMRARDRLDLLLDQAKGCGATLVIATHDQRIKSRVANHYELTAVNEPRAVA